MFFSAAYYVVHDVFLEDKGEDTATDRPGKDKDVILIMKQFMRSQCLSQPPVVILPCERAQHMRQLEAPTHLAPRNSLSERQLKEYRKTASRVEAEPWSLRRAATYLRKLCQENQDGNWGGAIPSMSFVTEEHWDHVYGTGQGEQKTQVPAAQWADFAPGTPREVKVSSVRRRARPSGNGSNGEVADPSQPARGRGRGRGGGRGRGRGCGHEQGREQGEEIEIEGELYVVEEPEADGASEKEEEKEEEPAKKTRRVYLWESQSQLGCSKCRNSELGCARCKAFHEKWKQKNQKNE